MLLILLSNVRGVNTRGKEFTDFTALGNGNNDHKSKDEHDDD